MARAPSSGSFISAAPRHTGTIIVVAVSLIVGAFGLGSVWNMNHPSSGAQASAHLPGVAFGRPYLINVTSAANAVAGCAPPARGLIEYCYEMAIAGMAGMAFRITPSDGTSGTLTTSDVVLSVTDPTSHVVPFVSVTLLNTTGTVLAAYTAAGGWVATGSGSSPAPVIAGDQFVLNCGTRSFSGDGYNFVAEFVGAADGESVITLP